MLVGTKADLEDEREVDSDEAEELARSLGMASYVETSAKEGEGLNEPFNSLLSSYLNNLLNQQQ